MTTEYGLFSNSRSLGKPITGPDGKVWHFQVWSGRVDDAWMFRIFFWDDEKSETGLLELSNDEAPHLSKVRLRMTKLAKDREYRKQFLRPLKFPLERYW